MHSVAELGSRPETVLDIKKGTDNWRYKREFYRQADECIVPPGHVAFAPCWFELGHDVRLLSSHHPSCLPSSHLAPQI